MVKINSGQIILLEYIPWKILGGKSSVNITGRPSVLPYRDRFVQWSETKTEPIIAFTV